MTDLLSIPVQVRDRLALDGARSGVACFHQKRTYAEERIALEPMEVRTDGDTVGVLGYGTTFDVPYDVAGGPEKGGWIETMVRGVFDKTLAERDDIRMLINHDGLPLARTSSGTQTITADHLGLLCDAPSLDLRNPRVQELRSVLERGDADQMSIAFRVIRQEWNDDYTERFVTEAMLFDDSIVAFPANKATIVGLRGDEPAGMPLSLARAEAQRLALR